MLAAVRREVWLAATLVNSIWFNRPYTTGAELDYIREAIANGHLSGSGPFAQRSAAWLQERLGCTKAYLTHSGTAALEFAALLADIRPGDEVVMPSFTFVSTANAVVLRGAVPVFAEIRSDTLNLDEREVEALITPRTRAIMPVHYAGVACEMSEIMELADSHELLVIEDAAHAMMATYRGKPLGGIGDLGCISFHETKNLICGEGGALAANGSRWLEGAEVAYEKGTDRTRFLRGQLDKYTWQETGSSYPMSELSAAFLWGQLEAAEEITARRMAIWGQYHAAFAELEAQEKVRRPHVPGHCGHNGHMYHLRLGSRGDRDRFIEHLAGRGVQAVFHFVPLHLSPAGRKYGRVGGDLPITRRASDGLVRLPLWVGMKRAEIDLVIDAVHEALARAPVKPVPA
jgi:dTDP-4-amino-4,6-dideoxygalactose transaminase